MKRMYAIEANRVFLLSAVGHQWLLYLMMAMGLYDRMALQFLLEIFLAVPAVVYLALQKRTLKSGVGLQMIGWKEWLLLVPFAVCVDKIGTFLNLFSQLFTKNAIGSYVVELMEAYPFPVVFFVIAVTPAVCEELVYRGILYRAYRNSGIGIAIVLTAVMFGVMHGNWNQFIYAFVLGMLFALVNEITGSVLPSVFLHLYINGRSVVLLYVALLRDAEWVRDALTPAGDTVSEQLLSYAPVFLISVAGAVIVLFLMLRCKGRRIVKGMLRKSEGTEVAESAGGWKTVISPALVLGILYCMTDMLFS